MALDSSEFHDGDIVQMIGLKSKKNWNGKLATIIGPFEEKKQRWPIQINFGNKSRALLKETNLKMHDEKAISANDKKSKQEKDTVNVVEIQSNRGSYHGHGPLGNKLRNLTFSKYELWKYIKNKRLKEYKSPFAQLLGYNLSICADPNSSDPENNALNAGSIFLTCALSNGLSPYQFRGNAIVFSNDENKIITTDRLWGILNWIFESMDYYSTSEFEMNAKQRNKLLATESNAYKQQEWTPRAGTGGVYIYNDNPNNCVLNSF